MHILIVTQYFWPENFRINELAFSLVEKGNEVTVVTGTPNYPKGKIFKGYGWFKRNNETYRGVRVLRVPVIPRGESNKVQLILNYLSYALNASVLAPFICPSTIDIIFVYQLSPLTIGIPGVVLKNKKRVPMFFWVQDIWPESLSAVGATSQISQGYKLVERLARFLYSKSDRILIQSQAFESSIEKYTKEGTPLYYFPNSAEKIYQPALPDFKSSEFNKMPEGFRIMFAGNIGLAQDFDTILATALILKNYDEIKWIIIGDGRARKGVEKKLAELEISDRFYFLGLHPVEKMPLYFSFADLMLVTLKKDPIFALTIPAKIQSYMACAKPIVAGLDGEGGKIISESGAGLACGSEDPQSLAYNILKIYHLPSAEKQKMGEAGHLYFKENFESDMLVSRLETWMKEEVEIHYLKN
jgi:colanic acid biosynthesis glycosyl transferase WcaI